MTNALGTMVKKEEKVYTYAYFRLYVQFFNYFVENEKHNQIKLSEMPGWHYVELLQEIQFLVIHWVFQQDNTATNHI